MTQRPQTPQTNSEVARILDLQDGVIGSAQALEAGMLATDVARLVDGRLWTAVHPGVYVDHAGPPTWRQRAWAAVLACAPAALDGRSAIRAHEGPGRRGYDDSAPIEVLVERGRRIDAPAGVTVRRSRRYADAARAGLSPPRLRYEEALLDLADRAGDEQAATSLLDDACGGRRTTAVRLLTIARQMPWLRRRILLESALADIAEGPCPAPGRGYLALVEQPPGERPAPPRDADVRPLERDVR